MATQKIYKRKKTKEEIIAEVKSSSFWLKVVVIAFLAYLFFGFMLIPCLNTLTSIFTTKDANGNVQPWAVIEFFTAGNMPHYVWNSLLLAACLTITVNVVGISLVLLTEYFEIKGTKIIRIGYLTTLVYSSVALVTGYMFLYDQTGVITKFLNNLIPGMNTQWFSGFKAVLFTMTFACTSNHMLFLRNAIKGIDYSTVEAARNMGASQLRVLFKVVLPTLLPTLFSLTIMTFITGLCAMSAPQLIGYDTINPEIVRLAGSTEADEFNPHARAALLSIILALFAILLLSILSSYERKGHYLSVSKTKTKITKQKISNPVVNVLAHIYSYVLFLVYSAPVVLIVLFSFQNYTAVSKRAINWTNWTYVNYFGNHPYEYMMQNGTIKIRETGISGIFAQGSDTLASIKTSFILALVAGILSCLIVVVACRVISRCNRKLGTIIEYALLFPWLLPTVLICYSYRIFFNSTDVFYVGNTNLYYRGNVMLLVIIAYTVVKLPFSLRMIKASFYSIDTELEDAARNLGASPIRSFLQVELPIIMPSVLAVFALNFNALFTEYDMSATFQSTYAKTYAMVIQSMTADAGYMGYNVNAYGRRCASTVFIMIVSFIILYLVYGVGSRDINEKLAIRAKRKARIEKVKTIFKKKETN